MSEVNSADLRVALIELLEKHSNGDVLPVLEALRSILVDRASTTPPMLSTKQITYEAYAISSATEEIRAERDRNGS